MHEHERELRDQIATNEAAAVTQALDLLTPEQRGRARGILHLAAEPEDSAPPPENER